MEANADPAFMAGFILYVSEETTRDCYVLTVGDALHKTGTQSPTHDELHRGALRGRGRHERRVLRVQRVHGRGRDELRGVREISLLVGWL
jgi:hypothetical protein